MDHLDTTSTQPEPPVLAGVTRSIEAPLTKEEEEEGEGYALPAGVAEATGLSEIAQTLKRSRSPLNDRNVRPRDGTTAIAAGNEVAATDLSLLSNIPSNNPLRNIDPAILAGLRNLDANSNNNNNSSVNLNLQLQHARDLLSAQQPAAPQGDFLAQLRQQQNERLLTEQQQRLGVLGDLVHPPASSALLQARLQQQQQPPLGLQNLLAAQMMGLQGLVPSPPTTNPLAASIPPADTNAQQTLQRLRDENVVLRNLIDQQRSGMVLETPPDRLLAVASSSALPNFPVSQQSLLSSNLDLLRQQRIMAMCSSATLPGSTLHKQGVPLSLTTDASQLPGYQACIRQSLEFFESTQDDVNTNVQGRKKKIKLGQVGIRCRHCADIPIPQRGRGSVYYPHNLIGVYQSALNMSASHLLESCLSIPDSLRQALIIQKHRRDTGCGGKAYWLESCKKLGLTENEHGLWFQK